MLQRLQTKHADALGIALSGYALVDAHGLYTRVAEPDAVPDATRTPGCGLHDCKPERVGTGDCAQTRADLDALIARLYGFSRDEFVYILDTFPVLRTNEKKAFGKFQSKRKSLEEYEKFRS